MDLQRRAPCGGRGSLLVLGIAFGAVIAHFIMTGMIHGATQ
jgi:hypothetical protein